MPRTLSGVRFSMILLALAQAPAAFSFQAGSQKIFIEPRNRIAPIASLPADTAAHLRVDASLVLIPANVSTGTGARIGDLRKENFRLFEDGVEQTISYFTKEDTPLSIGLLLDASGSMHNKMKQAGAAAAEFFKVTDAGDEFFLVEFSDRAKLVIPFTSETEDIQKKVARTQPLGRTALLDAVQLALVQMKKARNTRKAIVILSDGADNRSRSSFYQVKNAVIESGVQVYAMGIFDSMIDGGKGSAEEQNGPKLLDELTAESGGMHFRANTPDDLPGISARISRELRSQYVIGYSPDDLAPDGKYHRIKVALDPPPHLPTLRVHYRPGFYAPVR